MAYGHAAAELCGWSGAARHGAWERTAGAEAGRAGLCCWAENEAPAQQGENYFFSFSFLSQIHSNEILNLFKVVSKVGPKIEVAQKNVLYNFAKKSKVKTQLDFEL